MSRKVRWGIIGCGVIAPTHGKAITAAPDAELVATCDIVPEKAQKIAETFGAARWYTDYNELLKCDDIDVVSVCVPSGLHGQVTEAAAKAKKHVFTEKPLEITKEKIDRMIKVCHDEGIKLGCVFQMRTYANNQLTSQMVQEGRLGKMVLCDAYMKYYRSPEYYLSADWRGTWELDGGGSLMNQGVHGVDLLLYMANSDVESVVAQADHLVRDIVVEDTAVAMLKFKNGAYGVIEITVAIIANRNIR
jgi:predicted dehydrogenase